MIFKTVSVAALAALCLAATPAAAEHAKAQALMEYASGRIWDCIARLPTDRFEGGVLTLTSLTRVYIEPDGWQLTGESMEGFKIEGVQYAKGYKLTGYGFDDTDRGMGLHVDGFEVTEEDDLPMGLSWGQPQTWTMTFEATGDSDRPYRATLVSSGNLGEVESECTELRPGGLKE